jgi:hypothetical protein
MAGGSVPRELAHAASMRESESLSTAPVAARAVTARPSAPSDVRRPATGVPHPWTGDTSVHVRRVDHGGAGAETSVSAGGFGPEPGALRPVRPSRSAAPLEPTSGGVMTASEGSGLLGGVQTVEEQLRRLEVRLLAEAGGDRAAEEDVRRRLALARARFGSARIRQFLPILIERDVRRRLSGR